MSNIRRHRIASVAVGAAIIVGLGGAGAVAEGLIGSADIKDNSIAKRDIGPRAVGGSEVKLDSIKKKHLAPKLRNEMGQVVDSFNAELASPFVAEAPTLLGEEDAPFALELPSRGTYLITANTISELLFDYDVMDGGFVAVGAFTEGQDGEGNTGPALVGVDMHSSPVSTSTFTVSVPDATTLYMFGLPFSFSNGPLEESPVLGRVAATLVSSQYKANLAPMTDFAFMDMPPAVRQPLRSLERQLAD